MFADLTASVDWNTSFDWSQSSKHIEEDKLELNWDDDVDEGDDTDSPPMSMKLDKKREDVVHKLSENDDSKNLFLLTTN